MKLTWFAGTTIRIHIGGRILVADPEGAPPEVNAEELVGGADQTVALARPLPSAVRVDLPSWRPRAIARAIDEQAAPPVLVHPVAAGASLVDAAGEPPLLLLAQDKPPRLGRWAGSAVVVLFGSAATLVSAGSALLDQSPPRLIALAADEKEVDTAITALRGLLDQTVLVALEPGLALEI